jgi:poly-gamma-glutamate synthesis protein (capsule biosynthesis protein)
MTNVVTLSAVGDLILSGRYDRIVQSGEAGAVFARIQGDLLAADITIGNLECPLTSQVTPREDKLCIRGNPYYAQSLASAGFDLVSLANNHLTDFGPSGLADTVTALDAGDVRHTGAGKDLATAGQPVILKRNGVAVGFLSYCHASTGAPVFASDSGWGVSPLEVDRVLNDITRWASQLDHLVLLLHWGLEYSPMPTPNQVDLAHRAVDAGASLIIGHHSHMVQGIEQYNGAVIAYSLGNCTDSAVDWQGPKRHYRSEITEADRMGLFLTVELTVTDVHISAIKPLWLNDDGQPEPATGETRQTILSQIEERSAAITAGNLEAHWEKTLVDKRVLAPLLHWWRRGSMWDKVQGFRLSQLKTLYLLVETWIRIRLSPTNEKWGLFNSRNDTRPMPYAGDEETEDAHPPRR